jgi:hypothetical protein
MDWIDMALVIIAMSLSVLQKFGDSLSGYTTANSSQRAQLLGDSSYSQSQKHHRLFTYNMFQPR